MLVIDKPVINSDPPDLPPYLKKRGGGEPGRRIIILPDIVQIERGNTHDIRDSENNWCTTIYHWMNRITVFGEGLFCDPSTETKWESAHIASRTYRQWLETYECKDGIPPHIHFNGALISDEPDPNFYSRWQAWVREYFY